jgi:hypothetical protein
MTESSAKIVTADLRTSRRRRVLSGIALVLACLAIVVTTVGIWTHQVALNTNRFSALIEDVVTDPAVTDPVSARISTQVVDALGVQARLETRLPDALKPLVELQYRGTVWTQKNGKDWTVRAFLVSDDGGLGLDVAEDSLTLQAIQGALKQLALTPVARLRGDPPKRLEAEDFDRLVIGDTPRDLLLWLGNPNAIRQQWDHGTW